MQFDFGQNWSDFSANALTKEKIDAARKAFAELTSEQVLKGTSFLDIGFGQGLSLMIATEMGAHTAGCDINPKCEETLQRNRKQYFQHLAEKQIPVEVGSILESAVVKKTAALSPDNSQTFQIVHSWGVLHHTGNMDLAIKHAVQLVNEKDGILILAIYNRHWTSFLWKMIKWTYCKSPRFFQKLMINIFYPIIWLAKFAVTGENPKKQQRGMDFYYDIIDWVGGYPYEYASIEEMKAKLSAYNFECLKAVPAQVPTGCNEFVFKRRA